MQKPPASNFSSQNAFAALDTKKSKKKKSGKDKDDRDKKDKGKSTVQNGVAAASSAPAPVFAASTGPVNWADSDDDDDFDVPIAGWVQVRRTERPRVRRVPDAPARTRQLAPCRDGARACTNIHIESSSSPRPCRHSAAAPRRLAEQDLTLHPDLGMYNATTGPVLRSAAWSKLLFAANPPQ